jgi:hypothetical protein
MAEAHETVRQGRASVFLWWAMCAGPLAWAFDHGASYVATQHSCSTGHQYLLHLITVFAMLVALSGLVAAVAEYRALPQEAREEGRRPVDRAHFQALFGIVFSIAFAMVVIADEVPRWILSACD